MSFVAALATASEFIGLAKGIQNLIGSPSLDKAKLRTVLNALESLYFTPNGLLPLLLKISNGERPAIGEVQATMLEFNDSEPHVERAAELLNFDALSAVDFPLGLRTTMQAAVYGKLNLRRDLQNAMNVPSDQLTLECENAAKLVERITALNTLLEEIDYKLRK
jgi:hypothetical protein